MVLFDDEHHFLFFSLLLVVFSVFIAFPVLFTFIYSDNLEIFTFFLRVNQKGWNFHRQIILKLIVRALFLLAVKRNYFTPILLNFIKFFIK
jgi:hypothetical protein